MMHASPGPSLGLMQDGPGFGRDLMCAGPGLGGPDVYQARSWFEFSPALDLMCADIALNL